VTRTQKTTTTTYDNRSGVRFIPGPGLQSGRAMADMITIRTDDETERALDMLTRGDISRSAAIRQAVLEAATHRERRAAAPGSAAHGPWQA
jgi:hypothetical protein